MCFLIFSGFLATPDEPSDIFKRGELGSEFRESTIRTSPTRLTFYSLLIEILFINAYLWVAFGATKNLLGS